MNIQFDYSVKTEKSFSETVESVIMETDKAEFKVLFVHDVQETLAKKGFIIEPLKIIEICNAKNAYAVLQKDVTLSLFLPCKINVYIKDNHTYIAALKPGVMQEIAEMTDLQEFIAEVNKTIVSIVDRAKVVNYHA